MASTKQRRFAEGPVNRRILGAAVCRQPSIHPRLAIPFQAVQIVSDRMIAAIQGDYPSLSEHVSVAYPKAGLVGDRPQQINVIVGERYQLAADHNLYFRREAIKSQLGP